MSERPLRQPEQPSGNKTDSSSDSAARPSLRERLMQPQEGSEKPYEFKSVGNRVDSKNSPTYFGKGEKVSYGSDVPDPDASKSRGLITDKINLTPDTQRESDSLPENRQERRVVEGTVTLSTDTALAEVSRGGRNGQVLETPDGITVEYIPDSGTYMVATPGPSGMTHVELGEPQVQERKTSSDTSSEDKPSDADVINWFNKGFGRDIASSENMNTLFPDVLYGVPQRGRSEKQSTDVSVYERKAPEKTRKDAFSIDVDKVLAGSKGEKEPHMIAAIKECLTDGESISLKTKGSAKAMDKRIVEPLIAAGIDPAHLKNLMIIGERGGTALVFDAEGKKQYQVDPHMELPSQVRDRVDELIKGKYSELMTVDPDLQTTISIRMIEGTDKKTFREQQKLLRGELRKILQDANLRKRRIRGSRTVTSVRHLLAGRRLEKSRLVRWMLGDNNTAIDIQS